MNDYLGTLVLRALGEVSAVRPALQPIFAPTHLTAPDESEEAYLPAPLGPARGPEEAAGQERRTPVSRSGDAVSLPTDDKDAPRELERQPFGPDVIFEERQTVVRTEGDRDESPVEVVIRSTAPPAPLGDSRDRAEQPDPLHSERPAPPSRRAHALEVTSEPGRQPEGPPERPATRTASPRASIRAQAQHDRSPSSVQQTIHVSIGRVDVRAVMPSAPPPTTQRPASSRARLSLDEYLRNRDESPRR